MRTEVGAVPVVVTGQNFATRHGTRVLVVDDDPIVLQAAYERLSRAGYQVFTREEALGTASWVATEKPEFVILDVCMPALQGGELAQLIHRHRHTAATHVILHSGMDKAELSRLAQQSGAIGFIEKTADPHGLLRQFEQIVAQQRAADRQSSSAEPPPSGTRTR